MKEEDLQKYKKWLNKELLRIELEMNIQGEYILALVKDEDESANERIAIVQDLLECSLPLTPGLPEISREIVEKWDELKRADSSLDEGKSKEEEKARSAFDDLGGLAKHLKKENEGNASASLENEERKRREMILKNYGYEEEPEDVGEEEDSDFVNDNSQKVREEQEMLRTTSKLAHENKVQRDREALALDRQKKEEKKEKRKPVKQERRR